MAYPDKFVKNIPHYANLKHLVNTVIHVGVHEAEELLFYVSKLKLLGTVKGLSDLKITKDLW